MNINNFLNQNNNYNNNKSAINRENCSFENFGEKYCDNDNDSYIMNRNDVNKYLLKKTMEKEKSINSKKNDTKNTNDSKNISNCYKNLIKNNEVQN